MPVRGQIFAEWAMRSSHSRSGTGHKQHGYSALIDKDAHATHGHQVQNFLFKIFCKVHQVYINTRTNAHTYPYNSSLSAFSYRSSGGVGKGP